MGGFPIDNLPSDIIIDILSRLPAKSLLQFRCVRKSWRSLFSDPKFIKIHLHRANSDNHVGPRKLLLPTYSYFQSIDLEPQNNNNGDNYWNRVTITSRKSKNNNNPSSSSPSSSPSSPPSSPSPSLSMVLEFLKGPTDSDYVPLPVSVSGSCNGLVCMMFDRDTIILCNPCTRVLRELPKPSIMPFDDDDGVRLTHGFGYDSSADDYKLVIAASSSGNNTQVEVFSLNSNSWKRVEYINPSIVLDEGQGVFFNGALHWITSNRLIVSFNLETEEFWELVPIPPDHHDDKNYLIVLGGCLSVVCCHRLNGYQEWNLNRYQVWMMKEYGVETSWTKLFMYPLYSYYMVPLCLSKDGDVLLDVNNGEALKMYDLDELSFSYLDLEETPYSSLDVGGRWLYSDPATYIETLVSPFGNVEVRDEEAF